MRKSIVLLVAMAFVVAWAVPAAAYWEEGMLFKMHYPQLPDATPAGWDVLSSGMCEAPVCRVADDFQCTETGWVKDIHFWGSWKGDIVGVIHHFRLEIYTNDASGPYSKPGQKIWWYDWPYDTAHVIMQQAAGEGWWDPCTPEVIPDNHGLYYQYNIYLPQARWFCQEEGQVYWLAVYACLVEPGPQWGWKTSGSTQFMDDGVYGWTDGPWIGPLVDPTSQVSRDLAFVITGDPTPPQRVPSLTEWGVIILAMLIAAAGVIAVLKRRAAVRAC